MSSSDKIKQPSPAELRKAQGAVKDASKEILLINKRLAASCSRGIPAWRYGTLDWKARKVFDEQSVSLLFGFCDNSTRREINSIIERLNSDKPPKQLGDFLQVPERQQEVELLSSFFECYLGAIEEQELKVSQSNSKWALRISIFSMAIAALSLLVPIISEEMKDDSADIGSKVKVNPEVQ